MQVAFRGASFRTGRAFPSGRSASKEKKKKITSSIQLECGGKQQSTNPPPKFVKSVRLNFKPLGGDKIQR